MERFSRFQVMDHLLGDGGTPLWEWLWLHDLDLSASWVVGDSRCDVGLARSVGARALWIDGSDGDPGHDVQRVTDLSEAVDVILGNHHATAAPEVRAAFPSRRYASAAGFASEYSTQLSAALASIDPVEIEKAAEVLASAYRSDRAVFACGNGGSASIANHFQCDHVKGVRIGTGLTTRVVSLSTNIEILSAVANDIGYDAVFEYQLESQARAGDALVVISSSGRSPNVVRALQWARDHDLRTVALTGFTGGSARDLADAAVHVEAHNYGVIEDAHQACMHLLAQYVRQSLMTDTAVAEQVF